MRTIVDIPEPQLRQLAEQCERESASRAEIIRRAIVQYLSLRAKPAAHPFGLWKGRPDGVMYQQALRDEWK